MVTPLNVLSAAAITALLALLTAALLRPAQTQKWFERKRYQYEVTFALYMLSPTEKFMFNSILFLSLTLLSIAACLYLPEHICIISSRVWYYCFGENTSISSSLANISTSITNTFKGSSAVVEAMSNATQAAAQAASQATREAVGVAKDVAGEAGRKSSGQAAMEALNG